MKKVAEGIGALVQELGGSGDKARINMRTQEVLQRYRTALESVYRQTAPLHLAHTNKVIIANLSGVKTLVVYVDDSLFAAELNAQRELIRLRLLELFGEDIEDFQIRTSKWKKYRDNHPYTDNGDKQYTSNIKPIPLDENELEYVSNTAAIVEDARIRKSFERAMKADMEWKKGERAKISPTNGNTAS